MTIAVSWSPAGFRIGIQIVYLDDFGSEEPNEGPCNEIHTQPHPAPRVYQNSNCKSVNDWKLKKLKQTFFLHSFEVRDENYHTRLLIEHIIN